MNKLSFALKLWGFFTKYRGVITKFALIGGVCAAAYAHIYGQGYQKAEKRYLYQIHLTEQANIKAIEEADRIYSERIKTLTIKNKELQNALVQNAAERSQDPRGAEPGLGVDSVRRLNRIK